MLIIKRSLLLGMITIFFLSACNLPNQANDQSDDIDNNRDNSLSAQMDGSSESEVEDNSAVESATATSAPVAATATEDGVTVTVSEATNCRSGPRKEHDYVGLVDKGESVEAVAKPPASEPYLVVMTSSGECWLWLQYANVTGNKDGLPVRAIPATPTPPATGSIEGVVWLDYCSAFEAGDPPPGCLEGDPNVYYGNGVLEPGEFGIPGVVVDLSVGPCLSSGYATDTTNADGVYYFGNLIPGTYCVTVYIFSHGNENDLIPGGWTHPTLGGDYVQRQVVVGPGENVIHQHFGWDFQLD